MQCFEHRTSLPFCDTSFEHDRLLQMMGSVDEVVMGMMAYGASTKRSVPALTGAEARSNLPFAGSLSGKKMRMKVIVEFCSRSHDGVVVVEVRGVVMKEVK